MPSHTTPAAIVPPPTGIVIEEVFYEAFDVLQEGDELEYLMLDFVTWGQMDFNALANLVDSAVVRAALQIANYWPVHLIRYQDGPAASFEVPGFTVDIAGQQWTSPWAGQVVSGSYQNWLVLTVVKG